ncbi:uncharacterized protein DKFZp434B061-like [Portunus trituberculatus]|uniref:uncharacterized protein DKFZp434B061-like n=1 Tax=Portunus trituberculatus TaxID=210409 RepID=UPI001E1CF3D4|nr:uncharacterized protein DKFZp434B061-like [Portunus trituberculatus]
MTMTRLPPKIRDKFFTVTFIIEVLLLIHLVLLEVAVEMDVEVVKWTLPMVDGLFAEVFLTRSTTTSSLVVGLQNYDHSPLRYLAIFQGLPPQHAPSTRLLNMSPQHAPSTRPLSLAHSIRSLNMVPSALPLNTSPQHAPSTWPPQHAPSTRLLKRSPQHAPNTPPQHIPQHAPINAPPQHAPSTRPPSTPPYQHRVNQHTSSTRPPQQAPSTRSFNMPPINMVLINTLP